MRQILERYRLSYISAGTATKSQPVAPVNRTEQRTLNPLARRHWSPHSVLLPPQASKLATRSHRREKSGPPPASGDRSGKNGPINGQPANGAVQTDAPPPHASPCGRWLVGRQWAFVPVPEISGMNTAFATIPQAPCGPYTGQALAAHTGLPRPVSDGQIPLCNPGGGGVSGSVNRLLRPDSVRYMSVTSVVQRRLLTNDDRR